MSNFTNSELEVMKVLWEHGPIKPTDIQKHFPRPIKNAAIRSMLLVLLNKGHINRTKKGRAYIYEAKTKQHSTFQSMVNKMANVFCSGSTTVLIAQLMKSETLSDDDIRELKRIANQQMKENNKVKDKKNA